jgi:hypothetical protein
VSDDAPPGVMVQPGSEVRESQPPWITRVTGCKTVGRRGSRRRSAQCQGRKSSPILLTRSAFSRIRKCEVPGTIASSAFGNASKMATACSRVNQVVVAGHHQRPAPSPRQARMHPGPFRARPVRRSLRRPRESLPHQPERPRRTQARRTRSSGRYPTHVRHRLGVLTGTCH